MREYLWIACIFLMPLVAARAQSTVQPIVGGRIACAEGRAAGFACSNVDLLSFLPISEIGGSRLVLDSLEFNVTLNDIWGWTDPGSGREFALVGRSTGTAFVEVTDPLRPVFLGVLPSHDLIAAANEGASKGSAERRTSQPIPTDGIGRSMFSSEQALHDDEKGFGPWRDIKVYRNYALIVADATPSHGIQIFDLSQLLQADSPPVVFEETAHYDGMGSAHNIFVHEESAFAYAVGSSGGQSCGGGLHIVDISDPLNPVFSGCFADLTTGIRGTGYTHDVQCVMYQGPDEGHRGKEICVGSNETAISIADVTDKARPVAVSTASYSEASYIHQGWLTEDHRYFYQDDELDENRYGFSTRTIIWDLKDLDEPKVLATYSGTTGAIDHNQYVVGDILYQSNYKAGLRILDISRPETPVEVAYFDTYPPADNRGFEGSWSNYPFFESGIVVVSSIREGLFVLQPLLDATVHAEPDDLPAHFALTDAFPNPFNPSTTLIVRTEAAQHFTVTAYDILGRRVREIFAGNLIAGGHSILFDASGLPGGPYLIRASSGDRVRTLAVTLLK